MLKFEMMKEPGLDEKNRLRSQLEAQAIAKPKVPEEEKNLVAEFAFEMIIHEIMGSPFPERVNVELLRSQEYVKNHIKQLAESESSEQPSGDQPSSSDESCESTHSLDIKVDVSSVSTMLYVKEMIATVKTAHLPEAQSVLQTPIPVDNLQILRDFQGNDYELPTPAVVNRSVIATDIYLNRERTKRAKKQEEFSARNQLVSDDQEPAPGQINLKLFNYINELQHINNKAVFDALNEALDYHRPYGLKGVPHAWSSSRRELASHCYDTKTTSKVFEKAASTVERWTKTF